MTDAEIKKKLTEFTSYILFPRIKLLRLNVETKEEVGGLITEGNLSRQLEVKLNEIGSGYQHNDKIIVFGNYQITIKDTVRIGSEIDDKEETMDLITMTVHYRLILVMKDEFPYKPKQLTENPEWQEILSIFFNQSGKLMLMPYVRHIYDLLAREADFILPPIPPILIRK